MSKGTIGSRNAPEASPGRPQPSGDVAHRALDARGWIILGIILLAGLGLRLSYLHEVNSSPVFNAPIADAAFHDYWARGIASGNWTLPAGEADPRIREVPFLRPPGYPYFLGLIYALTGGSLEAARLIQMLLGLVNVVLAFFVGRAIFDRRVGFILAGFVATYWVFPYYEAQLHSPALSMTLGLGLVLALHRWTVRPRWTWAARAGILLGLSALVRTEALLLLPATIAWLVWFGRRNVQPRLLRMQAGAMLAAGILTILPATIRNAAVAHEFCPISANGGINFYVGNNDTADGVTTRIPILPDLSETNGWSCFSYDRIVAALSVKTGRKLNYADASSYFADLAKDYIGRHPGKFLALTLRRAALFWGPSEVANNRADDVEKRNSPVLRFLPAFPYALSLSLLGVVLLILELRGARRARKGAAVAGAKVMDERLAMLVLVALYVVVSFAAVLPFIVAGRFRAPLIPFVFVFGAYGLARVWVHARSGAWKQVGIAAAILVPAFVLCRVSFAGYHEDAAWWHTDRAVALSRAGQKNDALGEFRSALQANPGFVDARVGMGDLLVEMGRLDEALPQYQDVVTHRPTRFDVRQKLGSALLDRGRVQDAARELNEVVRQSPNRAGAFFLLGRALMGSRDYDGSLRAFDRCLELAPDEPSAHANRGIVLIKMQRPREGIVSLTRALQLKPDLGQGYLWLGVGQAAVGDLDKAAASYREAIRLEPKSAAPLVNMGNLATTRGSRDEAITWYRRAIEVEPNGTEARLNLASVLVMDSKIEDAKQQLREILRIQPDNQMARARLNELMSGRAPGGR